MFEALKHSPAITVPLVLHRLRMKATELREAKRSQQKIWNESNQKYYVKSLDHQGLLIKQNDNKMLRSKALLLEIENAFEEVCHIFKRLIKFAQCNCQLDLVFFC